MSNDAHSFLTKFKKALSKLFKSRKAPTSFKGPQELRQSRQAAAGITSTPRPVVQPPKPIEATRDTATTSEPARDASRLQPEAAVSPPLTQRSLAARSQDYGESADVSPTEPPTFRTDRPHSQAVSALEQDGVSERIKRNDTLNTAEEPQTKAERPVSGIVPAESQHAVEATEPEQAVDLPARQDESVPVTDGHNSDESHMSKDAQPLEAQTPEAKVNGIQPAAEQEQEIASDAPVAVAEAQTVPAPEPQSASQPEQQPEQEAEPADRVDPLTAPEVVNKFDDEKVPVINEPSSPAGNETKFRMSATSGPLEDFPAGEFY